MPEQRKAASKVDANFQGVVESFQHHLVQGKLFTIQKLINTIGYPKI